MKILIICCGVLKDEIEANINKTNAIIDIVLVPEHLHLEPEKLKIEIQRLIDTANEYKTISEDINGYNYIVLAFGLCGGALNGIKTNKHTVVIPKAHDCISFFLGSREKYNCLFNEYGGKAYWFTPSFLKQGFLPTKKSYEDKRLEYIQKFDEDCADFLINTERDSLFNYNICAVVDNFENPSNELYNSANSCALEYNWKLINHNASNEMFLKIVSGNYNEDDFLIVTPHKTIIQSNNDEIIAYE